MPPRKIRIIGTPRDDINDLSDPHPDPESAYATLDDDQRHALPIIAAMLDARPDSALPGDDVVAMYEEWLASDAPVIEAINRGDMAPFRERYPQFAMLRAPKVGHGKAPKPRKWRDDQRAERAAAAAASADVDWLLGITGADLVAFAKARSNDKRTIAALNRLCPDRKRLTLHTAIPLVAAIWSVPAVAVERIRKTSGKPKKAGTLKKAKRKLSPARKR